jgi:hypothetical protein
MDFDAVASRFQVERDNEVAMRRSFANTQVRVPAPLQHIRFIEFEAVCVLRHFRA